jgi:hypothetical protein
MTPNALEVGGLGRSKTFLATETKLKRVKLYFGELFFTAGC